MAAGQPLRGLVGQAMSAHRSKPSATIVEFIDTAISGSYQVPLGCVAHIGLFGAGRSGISATTGGDGGDAVYSLVPLQPKWTLTWAIGAGGSPGGDTTISWPGGSMLARGGGSTSGNLGQYISKGGAGGIAAAGTAGADGGGDGGASSGADGGGGGGAGLASKFPGFTQGGAGGNTVTSQEPGHAPGGGGAGDVSTTGAGAAGRALILILRLAA